MAQMTLQEFRGSAQWCDDLRIPLADEFYGAEIAPAGFIYADALYIEKVGAHWPEKTRAQGQWYLRLANCEWISDDLHKLEERLYAFAKDEGYVEGE